MSINKKILIVEDDQMLLNILAKAFAAEGFEVATAVNGEAGLIAAQTGTPDIMLLDVVMPKMDGLTMLKKLQAEERFVHLPVIVLTNLSDAESIDKGIKEGLYDFLVKGDWELAEIIEKVKTKLALR